MFALSGTLREIPIEIPIEILPGILRQAQMSTAALLKEYRQSGRYRL